MIDHIEWKYSKINQSATSENFLLFHNHSTLHNNMVLWMAKVNRPKLNNE